jgi:outer membrane autotransporter protein
MKYHVLFLTALAMLASAQADAQTPVRIDASAPVPLAREGELRATTLTALVTQADAGRTLLIDRGLSISQEPGSGLLDVGRLWTTGVFDSASYSGAASAHAARSSGGTWMAGVDNRVDDSTWMGAFLGIGRGRVSVDGDEASAKIGGYTLGAYGATRWDPLTFSYGLTYAAQTAHTGRGDDPVSGRPPRYDGATAQVFGQLTYTQRWGGSLLQPYLGLSRANARLQQASQPAPTEADPKAAWLWRSAGLTATRSTLGLRAQHTWPLPHDAALSLTGDAGWRHTYGPLAPAARVEADPDIAYHYAGAPLGRDALVSQAALALKVGSLTVTLDGTVASGRNVKQRSAMLGLDWLI